jgi:hypothetical protein
MCSNGPGGAWKRKKLLAVREDAWRCVEFTRTSHGLLRTSTRLHALARPAHISRPSPHLPGISHAPPRTHCQFPRTSTHGTHLPLTGRIPQATPTMGLRLASPEQDSPPVPMQWQSGGHASSCVVMRGGDTSPSHIDAGPPSASSPITCGPRPLNLLPQNSAREKSCPLALPCWPSPAPTSMPRYHIDGKHQRTRSHPNLTPLHTLPFKRSRIAYPTSHLPPPPPASHFPGRMPSPRSRHLPPHSLP